MNTISGMNIHSFITGSHVTDIADIADIVDIADITVPFPPNYIIAKYLEKIHLFLL